MKKRSERKKLCIRICLTVIAVVTALIFIMPIVLTISNSFMSAAEITSNYGSIFQKTDTGGKQYISQTVNLKFIPDMVTFSQYATVLFKSPDYLLKFWNSVILVVPIVVFQLVVAVLAAYGFTRTRGKLSAIVFFAYVILMMMPYQVTLVPNYLVLNWMKLLDTNWRFALFIANSAASIASFFDAFFVASVSSLYAFFAALYSATASSYALCALCRPESAASYALFTGV